MGNGSKKMTEEETKLLKEMEQATKINKKDLIRKYKEFKKDFPQGFINKKKICRNGRRVPSKTTTNTRIH